MEPVAVPSPTIMEEGVEEDGGPEWDNIPDWDAMWAEVPESMYQVLAGAGGASVMVHRRELASPKNQSHQNLVEVVRPAGEVEPAGELAQADQAHTAPARWSAPWWHQVVGRPPCRTEEVGTPAH